MNIRTIRGRSNEAVAAILVTLCLITACSNSGDTSGQDVAVTDSSTANQPATSALADTIPANSPPDVSPPTSSPPTEPATTDAGDWRAEVTAMCSHFTTESASIPEPDRSPAGTAAFVAALRHVRDTAPSIESIDLPAELRAGADGIVARIDAAEESLTAAEKASAGGDTAAAQAKVELYIDQLFQIAAKFALSGARCGDADPAIAAAAQVNVLLELGPSQTASGFGSIWVSERFGDRVVRVDPETGEVVATVDVGSEPVKLQPADGRMWVRTVDAFVAIDPNSNAVTATLSKADVGPAANRSWAVDGAIWICDGQRLHRYDPETLQPTALLELGIECGQVYATADLVVAWTYNEDDGESGTSAAAIIDPATNQLLATVDLPVDVGVPIVLDNAVFLPAYGGSQAVVVDRGTWTVSAIPDLGQPTGGSLSVSDGKLIFVPAADSADVLVVDASTFTVTDTIHTFGANSVAVADGSLWVVDDEYSVLQSFDIAELTTGSAEPVTSTSPTSEPAGGLVDGDYRTAGATRDELIAAAVANGVPEREVVAALDTAGIADSASATLRIGDGGWTIYTTFDGAPQQVSWRGSYKVVDADTIVATDGYCTVTLRYTVSGRELTFEKADTRCLADDPPFALGATMTYLSGPFTRVDPPRPGVETPYSTTDFAVPFDVTLPAWVTPVPVTEEPNVLLWEAATEDRGIRFVSPVSVYRPGSTTPSPVPDDYVAYLLAQEANGAILTDITETTIGGRPATVVTANTPDSIDGFDGSLGCQAEGLTAAECFGVQPEVTLRIAVIELDPAPLLVWLRDIRRPDGQNLEVATFDAMLATLDFREL
jgi:hypothetical protein